MDEIMELQMKMLDPRSMTPDDWAGVAKCMRDAARFQHLQNLPVEQAQAFFWNHSSRKERSKAIDADRARLANELAAAQPSAGVDK